MRLVSGIKAIGRAFAALDPSYKSRNIEEILERNGYEKTGTCSYSLPLAYSGSGLGLGLHDRVQVCGYNIFQKVDDVFIVSDMNTLTSHPLAGEEMSLTEACKFECPHSERIRSMPIAHATLRSVSNKEMLAYLQARFTSQ